MTGNIVYLGFGIAEIERPDAIPVIFALSMFAAGSYIGLRITTLRSKESGLWPTGNDGVAHPRGDRRGRAF